MIDEDGMKLTDDIYDCGVLAFFLLDGIPKEDDCSEDFDKMSRVSMSMRTEKAFATQAWSKVSPMCKELLSLMVVED